MKLILKDMGFHYLKQNITTPKFLSGLLLALLLPQPFSALAIVYQPGETLNPACAPTDSNCGVAAPITASSTSAFSLGGAVPEGSLFYVAGTSTLQNIIPAGNLQYSIGSPESRLQNVYTNNLILGSASFVMEDVGGILRFRGANSVIPGLVIDPSSGATINGNIFINGGATFANATTTGSHSVGGALVLGGESFQNLVGVGLKVASSALALDNSGDWAGTLDGREASYFLANSFSTSSANSWLGGKTTGNLTEGFNLYWTTERGNQNFAANLSATTTDALAEGAANKYYTDTRFDNRLTLKTTNDLTEGLNLYYTDARARNALVVSAPLSYASSTGVFSLATGNITAPNNPEITIGGGAGAILGSGVNIVIPEAGATTRGLVSTTTQIFAGDKTFYGGLKTESIVGAIMTAGSDGAFAYNFGSGVSNSLSKRIAQSSDDAEQNLATNGVNLTSSDLELVNDTGVDQEIGMRFQNIAIPQGAMITNAYIEFTVDGAHSGTTNLNFYGEAADNATVFAATTNNITSRAKTSATVAWSNVPAWTTIGQTQQTPNIAPLVQEIINRAGWLSGNSLAVIVNGTTGSLRRAVSYNGGALSAALLVVQYTTSSTNVSYTINNLGPGLFRINDEFNDVSPFVVDSSGNVGIGTTTPAQLLHIARSTDGVVARFTDANGDCDINPTNTALVCASDVSLKKNILTLDNSLEKVLALNPVTFNWNGEKDGAATHPGFIAQEVEALFPPLVSANEDGLKSIAYSNFAPILTKAIQEVASLGNSFKINLIAWFADATNGIGDFFAKKVRTEEVCLKKSDGSEYCVNGDDLETIMSDRAGAIITNQEQVLDAGQQETIPVESAPMEIASTELDSAESAPAEIAVATTTEEVITESIPLENQELPIEQTDEVINEPAPQEPALEESSPTSTESFDFFL